MVQITDEILIEQVIQLELEIRQIEIEKHQLELIIHDKKYTLHRLKELLEIRGVCFDA